MGSEKADTGEEEQKPWEVVRWTRLKKISNQAFSEVSRRTFGVPTFLTIAASIVIGTRKGLVLVFDYQQNLKQIIGQGTAGKYLRRRLRISRLTTMLAAEAGSITSLAIAADHSTIAAGHANGSIFTWELSRPTKPFLHIPPLDRAHLQSRTGDGHISDSAVLHVDFLGQRRTALVSADDAGMAFSHLATRGLGAVARKVKTTRILGRYPTAAQAPPSSRKPSSVLALSSLPLGNVERSTDGLGLTAMLTPYLLVIVSTTPIAQTQFKLPRDKAIATHGSMTGSLAWFPAVKIKGQSPKGVANTSASKLAYCWSNVLSVLEIEEETSQGPIDPEKQPTLAFTPRSHWRSEEAILTIQWLSRSILAVLTVTQRLLIMEDVSLRVADSSDLVAKHIFHQDLFSRQLSVVVDNAEQEDDTMHGVIPDAYYMSFKAYKSRLFLLGVSDLSMGILSNWTDRLSSLIAAKKYVTAIELATSYYNGESDRIIIGLPEDEAARKRVVGDKLMEVISSAIQYVFDDEDDEVDRDLRSDLQRLANVVFAACISMDETDILFNQMYEAYSDASMQDILLYTLEPYIIDGKITIVPTEILKDLLNWFSSHGFRERLEAMIISLETHTMDIDHVASICKQNHLYDALIYVWTRGLSDYITPLIDLITIVLETSKGDHTAEYELNSELDPALKLFPYMSYTLTGRQYPGDAELPSEEAAKARSSMYGFLFAHSTVRWPRPRGRLVTTGSKQTDEQNYPYLRTLLHFDAYNFLSMLNEAFEDSFLNGTQEQQVISLPSTDESDQSFGARVNRQRIVNILLETITQPEYSQVERLYLDIFLARNLPKFQQFILLPGSTLRQILAELCDYPTEDLASECQLSVEYLLSVYHVSDTEDLISQLIQARFFRVLKATYRANRQFAKWLETFFEDSEEREGIFACLNDCLRSGAGLSVRQMRDVKSVIVNYSRELASIDAARTTSVLSTHSPDLLGTVYDQLDDGSRVQYLYLHSIFEPETGAKASAGETQKFIDENQERYIELMCQQEPSHVVAFVSTVKSGDLRLDRVLPALEQSGVVDAAVTLLACDGLSRDAMDRLVKHLATLRTALTGLLDSTDNPDLSNAQEATDDLLSDISKYIKLGIWLCQGEARAPSLAPQAPKRPQRRSQVIETDETDLTLEEALWVDLIDAGVTISRGISSSAVSLASNAATSEASRAASKASETLRLTVQQIFTALLASTTSVSATAAGTPGIGALSPRPPSRPSTPLLSPTTPTIGTSLRPTLSNPPKQQQDHRFLNILRTFLSRTALTTPTLSDLRKVLSSIFSAYAFESSMLSLAHRFIEKDVWKQVEDAERVRERGWRVGKQVCEGCRKRCWGSGVGGGVWEAWRTGEEVRVEKRRERWIGDGESNVADVLGAVDNGKGKGKAKAKASEIMPPSRAGTPDPSRNEKGKGRDNGKGKATGLSLGHGSGLGISTDHLHANSPGAAQHDQQQPLSSRTNTASSALATAAHEPIAISTAQQQRQHPDPLILFNCTHIYHRTCLDIAMREAGLTVLPHTADEDEHVSGGMGGSAHARAGPRQRFRCPVCYLAGDEGGAGAEGSTM